MWNWKEFVNHILLTKFNMLKPVSNLDLWPLKAVVLLSLVSLVLTGCGLGNGAGGDDPVVVENPVAFIKRPLLFDEDNDDELVVDDLREPQLFRPGAILYIKDSASPSESAVDISSQAFPAGSLYDVRDLEASADGTKLLFSMRAPDIEGADDEDQPKWNIWEYDISTSSLRRVITGNDTAEQGHDLAPTYLPDGRILFSSTRQQTSKAILLDEDTGKGQYSGLDEERDNEAFVLHVMNADGSLGSIQQITFNQSHDLDPFVRSDGKIVFSRWDNAGQTRNNGMNLYEVNPDGTELNYLYGRHSHDSGDAGSDVQYAKPREAEDGGIVVQLREFLSPVLGFQPVAVDVGNYIEHDVEIGGVGTSGQSAIITGLSTTGEPTLDGNYGSLFPLYDGTNRYLASWSICRVQAILSQEQIDNGEVAAIELCDQNKLDALDDTYEAADPLYGLWILDASDDTKLPIELAEEGFQYDEAVILTERDDPIYIPPATLDGELTNLALDGFGVLKIRSVYDLDGAYNAMGSSIPDIATMADPAQTTPDNRPARFIRFEKPVAMPSEEVLDLDNSAFGVSQNQLMREILGYAPIEPDGSVNVAVPANVALAFSILDVNGKRIQSTPRHQNWLQVMPGEVVSCNGCHDTNSAAPHGRTDAQAETINAGAIQTGLEFPNTDANISPDFGQTMAEAYGIRSITPDIIYQDDWADDVSVTKAESFSYLYDDLETQAPFSNNACSDSWESATPSWGSACRIIVNYEQHIHPLWSVDRQLFDAMDMLIEDRTCIACHTNTDELGAARVPDAQLDLSNGASDIEPDHFKSYRELLSNDNQQELDDNDLLTDDIVVGTIDVPRVDENGDPVLDPDTGLQIIDVEDVTQQFNVAPTMNVAGARNSNNFMSLFESGGTHEGYLSPAELRLIAEWLDIGGQYFNNPFDAQ